MHWNGRDWQQTYFPQELGFYVRAIWGSDSRHVWASLYHPGRLLEWNEGTWIDSGLPSNSLDYWGSVWGTKANDVWTVSQAGVYHWDGDTWTSLTPPSWREVEGAPILWGKTTDDVTVLIDERTLFHWDGSSWESAEPPPAFYLGGTGPGDAWFHSPGESFLWRQREGVWEMYQSPTPYMHAVWSHSDNEAWVLSGGWPVYSFLHFDGTDWSFAGSVSERLDAIGGSSPDDIWAVGEQGAIIRVSNGRYEEQRTGSIVDLNDVFGFSERELWAIGAGGTLLRRSETEWQPIQAPTQQDLTAIGGISPSDLWVVGARGATLHFDGKNWSNVPTGTSRDLSAVWASGPADVWAGTRQVPGAPTVLLHWDGTAWSNWTGRGLSGSVFGFWGAAPNDVWAVGSFCDYFYPFNPWCVKTLSHFDGSDWTVDYVGPGAYSTGALFAAIWGADSQDIWALSGEDTAYHWDGKAWSQAPFPEQPYSCWRLWGRAKNDIYALCSGRVFHWDGILWSTFRTPNQYTLPGMWGVDSKLWVVGGNGTVLMHELPIAE